MSRRTKVGSSAPRDEASKAIRKSKAAAVLERKPLLGWRTSDEDEIDLRRWRGSAEILDVVARDSNREFFGDFRVRSASGADYHVEIRSLDGFTNSCGCIDHRVNALGTCKHIEGALAALRRGRIRAFRRAAAQGSPRIEIFLDCRGVAKPAILWPETAQAKSLAKAREWLRPWLDEETLVDSPQRIEELTAALAKAPPALRAMIRISRHFAPWLERARRRRERLEAAAAFADDVAAGRATLDVLAHPLLPYQREGAMHLAFSERALLADDMGLGKTIQAIAGCELLARRKGVERVLVVCPSPYAFVLTGTPIENRIDELYSIVQYLDPELLGPLFRFNREFYELDERGRPIEYKNLALLRERIAPLMLRRRKADVEKELPGRTVKTYFVPMAEEQKLRYEDYRQPAARLIATAQRRPLRQEEFDRLQRLLACMRMVCDTPAILDPACRISPKLEELEKILADLLDEPDRKIIVFSEWERMLTMVRELAGEMGVEAAWHTGSLPQERRRAEINRFKRDPACRLFLSTDSGSVGLNLQVASAVVNVDLPWNPAKLEQRIARAWRKNQPRSVSVVNLVTEDSVEHSILHLIGQKQALADGVLDGAGDISALKMPSGRGAFIERMQAMMGEPARGGPRMVSAQQAFVDDLVERLGEKALLVEERRGADGKPHLIVVLDMDHDGSAAEAARAESCDSFAVEFMDVASWRAMRRLVAAGLLQFALEARELHRASALPADSLAAPSPAPNGARAIEEADRALRMAKTLADGGFPEEAPALLAKSLRAMAAALLAARSETPLHGPSAADGDIRRLVDCGALPPEAIALLQETQSLSNAAEIDGVAPALAGAARILATIMRNEPRLTARPR